MELNQEQLKTLLVGANLLRPEQFAAAVKDAKEKSTPLDEFLSRSGIVSDEHLGQVIANHLRLPFKDLTKERITRKTLLLLPEKVAKNQKAAVFLQDQKNVHLATANPGNHEFFNLLARKTGKNVRVYYATPQGIEEALAYYKTDTSARVRELIEGLEKKFQDDDAVKLANLLLEYAYDNRASDVHLEPLEGRTAVRFRIDGVLHDVFEVPPHLHEILTARIKVLAALRTDEHRRPQDGQLVFRIAGQRVDMRVSIIPVTDGERVVLRVLSERSRTFTLETTGLSGADLQKVRTALEQPWGMILAVGPTGCGKTTTLYTMLKILNTREVNIATIEDPVEYDVEGVNQTQVDPPAGLTFATGLRSLVRQDPDIFMVGEIRDNETAEIAINAALTGHLVLSTFHANNAVTTLVRLLEMDIEPYLVTSTVSLVIAQRLVRKLCERCRESYTISAEALRRKLPQELHAYFPGKRKLRFYRSRGCPVCSSTGFVGRTGVFEVLEISDAIRALVVQRKDSSELEVQAVQEGMQTMLEDGLQKVRLGVTTLEEVLQVSQMQV